MTHWTDDRIDKLDKLIAAARDLADLELEDDIPESWGTEWLAFTAALAEMRA